MIQTPKPTARQRLDAANSLRQIADTEVGRHEAIIRDYVERNRGEELLRIPVHQANIDLWQRVQALASRQMARWRVEEPG
jgi:hypothetical protein